MGPLLLAALGVGGLMLAFGRKRTDGTAGSDRAVAGVESRDVYEGGGFSWMPDQSRIGSGFGFAPPAPLGPAPIPASARGILTGPAPINVPMQTTLPTSGAYVRAVTESQTALRSMLPSPYTGTKLPLLSTGTALGTGVSGGTGSIGGSYSGSTSLRRQQ